MGLIPISPDTVGLMALIGTKGVVREGEIAQAPCVWEQARESSQIARGSIMFNDGGAWMFLLSCVKVSCGSDVRYQFLTFRGLDQENILLFMDGGLQ